MPMKLGNDLFLTEFDQLNGTTSSRS